MPDYETYTGAHGFNLTIISGLDLTASSNLKLKIKSPLGNTSTRALSIENVSGDKVVYKVASNDFSVPGLYRLQISDETEGKKVLGAITKIRVRPSLEYVGS